LASYAVDVVGNRAKLPRRIANPAGHAEVIRIRHDLRPLAVRTCPLKACRQFHSDLFRLPKVPDSVGHCREIIPWQSFGRHKLTLPKTRKPRAEASKRLSGPEAPKPSRRRK
jgi:hypothetical protein